MRNSSPASRATVFLFPSPRLEPFCNFLQEQVAAGVPERVVDVLEAVKVDEQKRNFVLLPAGAGQRL